MKKVTLLHKIKSFVASVGWKMFIWGNEFSQEEYWERIYEQESNYRKHSDNHN